MIFGFPQAQGLFEKLWCSIVLWPECLGWFWRWWYRQTEASIHVVYKKLVTRQSWKPLSQRWPLGKFVFFVCFLLMAFCVKLMMYFSSHKAVLMRTKLVWISHFAFFTWTPSSWEQILKSALCVCLTVAVAGKCEASQAALPRCGPSGVPQRRPW